MGLITVEGIRVLHIMDIWRRILGGHFIVNVWVSKIHMK